MATLKSIKNKYLDYTDGTVLGVTTNIENILALSFKLSTADSLAKFNLVDGFADDYNDATGVDAGNSTDDTRDTTNNYYSGKGGNADITAFTANGTFNVPAVVASVNVLVVAGGGGGGENNGSGGGGAGAGGLVYVPGFAVTPSGTVSVTVGAGAGGGDQGQGGTGTDSTFGTLTAKGGGGGGYHTGENGSGGSTGGSGGGGGWQNGGGGATNQSSQPGDSGTYGFGSTGAPTSSPSGFGGGAGGGAGGSGSTWVGGAGKDYSSVYGSGYGESGWFAGGGGGGATGAGGPGGQGGGGDGSSGAGNAGTVNTGGGGGGGNSGGGGTGGSGVVLVQNVESIENMTLQSTAYTAQSAPTTTRIILDEWAFKGAQTLNTDIKAYASRDDGTTFTQITLASQGYLLGAGGINGNTQLMLHCDGTDDGTTFTDSCTEGGNTAKTWTASGNAVTSTDQFKFGTASAYFDGTGDYINTPATGDWDFGSDDFTIDFWMRPGVVDSQQRLFGNLNSGGSSSQFEFILGGSNNMSFSGSLPSGLAVTQTATTIAINTWYHIAITRSGTDWRLFVNGTAGATASFSGTMGANTTTSIGRSGAYTSQLYTGYIDEVRITTGVALWTSNFTSPASAYQTSRRLLSGSVDISGQPSGTSVKYKLTTHNQTTSKQTRVYGTSMAWA